MSLVATVLLNISSVQGGDHARWPADWNDWSDPALLVTVGNPGNAPATHGSAPGAVDYTYDIGKFEVTAGQYTKFLNSKAATDTYGLYNTEMWNSTYGCKVQRSGSPGSYTYSVASDYANRPVNYVSYWDAARFANWLHNGRGSGDTETGAYTLDGYNDGDGRTIARNVGARWFLPSVDEWYKAAYHKNDGVSSNYFANATGSDTPMPGRDQTEKTNPGNNANSYDASSFPIESLHYTTLAGEFQLSASPYGTFDQGGNVWEWDEAVVHEYSTSSSRGISGGSFQSDKFHPLTGTLLASYRLSYGPSSESVDIGFRVARTHDPATSASTDWNITSDKTSVSSAGID